MSEKSKIPKLDTTLQEQESCKNKKSEKKNYKQLKAMEQSLSYDIASLCEYLAIVREILMLYYWDNREDLKEL